MARIGLMGGLVVCLSVSSRLAAQAYQWTTLTGQRGDYRTVDGSLAVARFYSPSGIAVDALGTIYVTDVGNHTLRKITAAGVVTTVAGSAENAGYADGTGGAARFNNPRGLAIDGNGNVFVADAANDVIRKVTPAGVVSTFAGTPRVRGNIDGKSGVAQFSNPVDVAVGPGGEVFVADNGNGTIRKISTADEVTTLTGIADGKRSMMIDGPPGVARLGLDLGIAVDASGTLFVSDYAIRRVTPDGHVTTVPGTGASGMTYRFVQATGISVDSAGSLFVADPLGRAIWQVPRGETAIAIGGGNTGNDGTSDGTGTLAGFGRPMGIAVDALGTVYVTDQSHSIIRRGAPLGRPRLLTTRSTASVSLGAPALFSVLAGGAPQPSLQWYRDGEAIPGATGPVLPIDRAAATDAGAYSVMATNSFGSTTQVVGSLAVESPPTITAPPQSAILTGGSATLSVSVGGAGPFTYQWLRDGQPIPGATSATYSATAAGDYSVRISHGAASTTSAAATVTLASRLVNIATRGIVQGSDGLVAGFVIDASGGASKQLLLRGVGPALGAFGIADALAHPVLTINRGNEIVATNAGWDANPNAPAIAAAAQAAGAFPLAAGKADASLLVDLPPGAYTMQVDGGNGARGTALIEVYEVRAERTRLLNVSTRGRVTENESLTAGVVVRGGDARLLVRAIGPALGQFGIEESLTAPRLRVFKDGEVVVINEGWGRAANAAAIPAAATATGAFALPAGSNDAAALLTATPGNYTAEITGVGGTTGIALIEIYAVP